MVRVPVTDKNVDGAIRRFSMEVKGSGVLKEATRRQTFETNGEKRRRKEAAARKRREREVQEPENFL